MERLRTLGKFAVALLFVSGCASSPPRKAEARVSHPQPLAREAAEVIKASALVGREVDWEAELRRIESAEPAMEATAAVRAVLAAYGDSHASYQTAAEAKAWHEGQAAAKPAQSTVAQSKTAEPAPRIPDGPMGNLLDAKTGYIMLPPCGTGDERAMTLYAWTIRGLVASMAASGADRWVIDFRLNGGGNIWPMLVGLQPLLGDGVKFRSIMPRGEEQKFGLTGTVGWIDFGGGPVVNYELVNAESPAREVNGDRVAVLTGPWTMSSGEMMTVAFVSRGKARTFGEPTGGLTTITGFFPLSDGSVLVLPTGRVATADGSVFDGKIAPEESVEFADWPRPEDHVVTAAREWLGR